jgi:hypothetical protein
MAERLEALEGASTAKTAEDLNRELEEIVELNALAIDVYWEIEALESSRQSQMDAAVVELHQEYQEAAPAFARKRLEEDMAYQRLVGRIEELRRIHMKQSWEVYFRMNRLAIDTLDHAAKSAPWFSASAGSMLNLIS